MTEILSIATLALITISHPCTAAPNVAAMAYINTNASKKSLALALYIIGHTIAYMLGGVILAYLLREGIIELSIVDTEWIVPVLTAIFAVGGLILIFSALHSHSHEAVHLPRIVATSGGALMSGVVIALMLCPEAALAIFGVMLPLTAVSQYGMLLPIIFAIVASLPLSIVAVLLRKGKIFKPDALHHSSGRWNLILGILFLSTAAIIVLF